MFNGPYDEKTFPQVAFELIIEAHFVARIAVISVINYWKAGNTNGSFGYAENESKWNHFTSNPCFN